MSVTGTDDTPPECPYCKHKGYVTMQHVIHGAIEIRAWICQRCHRVLQKIRPLAT